MKDQNEFKKDLHEWLAEMKARREINRKRDEEQACWDAQFNAPLDLKDRDWKKIIGGTANVLPPMIT